MKTRAFFTVVFVLLCAALSPLASAAADVAPPGVHLRIESIGVDTPIVTAYLSRGLGTWDVSRIGRQVAYLDGTSWFGSGNTVLAGHSENSRRRPSVFYRLGELNGGDGIVVTVNGVELRYAVANKYTVDVYDLNVLMPTGDDRITLMTCDPASYDRATGSYTRRIIVVATRAG